MCFPLLEGYVALWGPLATISSGTLWYLDSKDAEIEYMPEMRFGIALSIGIPGFILALCLQGVI